MINCSWKSHGVSPTRPVLVLKFDRQKIVASFQTSGDTRRGGGENHKGFKHVLFNKSLSSLIFDCPMRFTHLKMIGHPSGTLMKCKVGFRRSTPDAHALGNLEKSWWCFTSLVHQISVAVSQHCNSYIFLGVHIIHDLSRYMGRSL